MFTHVKRALKTPEIRKRLLFMLFALIIIRVGSQIPVAGLNGDVIRLWIENNGAALGLLDLFSGGSLSNMSIFALSITPYITASIIVELMTIVIPKLKELSDDEDGRKKKANINKYLGIALSAVQAIGMMLMFSRQGLLAGTSIPQVVSATVLMVAGSAFLIWFADRITTNGYGNGTSFILLVNIAARIPNMLISLYEQFVKTAGVPLGIFVAVLIAAILLIVILLVVILEGGERNIPITNSRKVSNYQSRRQDSGLPLKVNMAGVVPIIFAQTIMSMPAMIRMFVGASSTGVFAKIANALDQNYWFSTSAPWYSVGFIIHLLLVFFFAYFYTDITFSPYETARNLQKRGAMIPGMRPGKQTADYLASVTKSLIFIGAVGLVIVTTIPMLCVGLFHANVSFGGTSVIIITGVILEITKQISADLAVRGHSSFLGK